MTLEVEGCCSALGRATASCSLLLASYSWLQVVDGWLLLTGHGSRRPRHGCCSTRRGSRRPGGGRSSGEVDVDVWHPRNGAASPGLPCDGEEQRHEGRSQSSMATERERKRKGGKFSSWWLTGYSGKARFGEEVLRDSNSWCGEARRSQRRGHADCAAVRRGQPPARRGHSEEEVDGRVDTAGLEEAHQVASGGVQWHDGVHGEQQLQRRGGLPLHGRPKQRMARLPRSGSSVLRHRGRCTGGKDAVLVKDEVGSAQSRNGKTGSASWLPCWGGEVTFLATDIEAQLQGGGTTSETVMGAGCSGVVIPCREEQGRRGHRGRARPTWLRGQKGHGVEEAVQTSSVVGYGLRLRSVWRMRQSEVGPVKRRSRMSGASLVMSWLSRTRPWWAMSQRGHGHDEVVQALSEEDSGVVVQWLEDEVEWVLWLPSWTRWRARRVRGRHRGCAGCPPR